MRRVFLILIALAAVAFGAQAAYGERVKQGDLLLSFDVGFAPQRLPRDRLAPITVDLSGSVKMAGGEQPPQLRSILLELNSYGRIDTRGLPVCPRGQLEATSTEIALERCREALVGHGRFGASVDFPDREPFPVEGKMLAFNGRSGGKPTIFLHIYGVNPVKATIVLAFKITREHGTFGTRLFTKIPKIASDLGYVTSISLAFGRTYRHAGERHSFISARCATFAGFPGAVFPLARGAFTFANGQHLSTTLIRRCRVR